MSDANSTRSRFLLRQVAALAVERHRSPAPTLEQHIAIARIRVRFAARDNDHRLGAWNRGAGVDEITCRGCGAVARVELAGEADVDLRELLARRCTR